MSFMSRAQDWLRSKLQDAAGVSITYTRGAYSVALTAVLGRTAFASNMQGAARVEFGELDLLIQADELILNGAQVEPARGDRVAVTLNGTALTLELMTPQTGEPAWRYADPQRQQLRIHCKRVP